MKFITSVTQYRTISEPHFDRTLDLGNTKYGPDIIEWRKHIPDGVLRKILRKLPVHDEKEKGDKYYNAIPVYIRNVYAHCKEYDKVCM